MAAVLLVAGIIILPYFLEPTPSPEEADRRIRLLLKREFFNREMAMVRERGRRLPGYDRARQWKEKIHRIDRITFLSIRVNRLIPDVLLLDPTPHFVVRVAVQDNDGEARTRYFLLRTVGIDTETSYMAWFFSI
ncbi:MAG: hypothetical protein JRK53_28915 [Deltaproteobacteria bacterium]|nr:hypothetical protein [Deltaproteobacteria bacterium]